ncbi:hypothetical protein Tco_1368609 [Tanacetum coccineum]
MILQIIMILTMASVDIQAPSSSCSHSVNEDIASHFDDRMENNAENDAKNPKDDYTHSQHHLDLLIKACAFKTEIPTIDVLVPPDGDDRLLHTMKPNDACDQVDVDHFEDDYMFMLNNEEQPVKTSLDDMELGYDVEKLEICNGVVTFYDSLGWAGGNRRRWWRQMKKLLPEKLTVYLVMHGILESKGISTESYNITYKLSRNLPLTVNDPLETALAYRERMLEYFWNHKIEIETTLPVV